MTTHTAGINAMIAGRDDVGAVFWSDREIRNYLNQTHHDMKNSQADMFKFAKASTDQKVRDAMKAFIKFYQMWFKWYWSTDNKFWLTTAHIDTARQYRKRLRGWRQTFADFGHKASTPDPDIEKTEPSVWKTVALGAGGAVAGFLLISLIRR